MKPYFETELGKLYHGDCLEIMPTIKETIDMVLTDPPYGTTACKWDSVIPIEPMWLQLKRLIKPNGAIVMTASQPFTTILISSNIKMFKYELIWEKDKPSNFALANKQPMKYHENVCIFYTKQPNYNKQITLNHKPMNGQASYGRTTNGSVPDITVKNRFYGGKTTRNPKSILKFNTVKHNSPEVGGFHPTQKPLSLMEYLIKTYTNKNETVLDFASGSGTTGVACERLNRKYVMIEKEEKYCNITKQRIQKETQQLKLFT